MKKFLVFITIIISLLVLTFSGCDFIGSKFDSVEKGQEYEITWVVDDTTTITKVKEGGNTRVLWRSIIKRR